MTIQSILCIFGGSENELNAANTALMLGKEYSAQVRFLHISPDPSAYASMYGYGDCYATPALLDACEKDNKERLAKTRQYVAELTAKYHTQLDSEGSPAHHTSAKLVHLTGRPDDIIAQEGRLSDLIITQRTTANALYDSSLIAALFNTGRPVILLPVQTIKAELGKYKTIAVAWKGTLDAARAIYNAMPFLERAEKVIVLTAEGAGETYDLAAEAALMEYLHAHGMHAQGIIVAAGNLTAGEALLTRAKELGADLLVMGAYGHTRFREMMLGGVTNHVLEEAEIPLLLSH